MNVTKAEVLEVRTFSDPTAALDELFDCKRSTPGNEVVLVRAETDIEVRLAYENYFSDEREFIRTVEEGCEALGRSSGFLNTNSGLGKTCRCRKCVSESSLKCNTERVRESSFPFG